MMRTNTLDLYMQQTCFFVCLKWQATFQRTLYSYMASHACDKRLVLDGHVLLGSKNC